MEHLRAVEVGGDYGEDPHGRRGGNALNTVGTKRKDRCQMLLFCCEACCQDNRKEYQTVEILHVRATDDKRPCTKHMRRQCSPRRRHGRGLRVGNVLKNFKRIHGVAREKQSFHRAQMRITLSE